MVGFGLDFKCYVVVWLSVVGVFCWFYSVGRFVVLIRWFVFFCYEGSWF